ncbi:peptide ABC transporter ATP-binding protein [Lactiplantibacillus garii]|uniref:Peptide ABC transporter ATP-binding protein n=1 Tax=Lactiplantibacillus garii TaxID=2306423 RepID=A0A426D7K8_9LACO|nr:EamA family transporter [Lactiplantibacillus garii]RRK10561.1 peptide ABC transporter ATP-binding protein [Lactiplantibacillus garii]
MEKKTLGFVLASAGPFFWGSSGTVAQHLFDSTNISPLWLVSIRMVVSGLLLLIYGAVRKMPVTAVFKRPAAAGKLVAFSLLGMVGTQLTYFMAISRGNAATAAILQALSPVLIILFITFRTWRFPSKVDVISVVSAIVGTVLIVTEGSLDSLALPLTAVIWGLLAAVGATIYTLMPTKLIKDYGATPIVGWSMLIGGLFVFVGTAAWRHVPRLSVGAWLEVGFVVIFGTMLAYLFFLQSLEFILPTTASVLGTIEPLSATVLSVIFLNVNFNAFGITGAVLIVGVTVLQFMAAQAASFGNKV